ncbi:flagellar biosynthesis protein FlgB [Duganella sp. Leaf126]|uniref:flagellar basal body rod protein FlgB n=1 Tax=Duganella sp. Leaf126 TaxID=1736266 RepID=UPI0006FB90B3|nr:flagellar basal body rod protein FlgB [Duganella sp. Leaf126]KQQ36127.1 flagellar biosynthesis protein FlgB [Duganella sp. Leaf126]
MGISFNQVTGVHADALQLRAERTRILAANLANENTPGFQARDMDFGAALADLQAQGAGEPGSELGSDDEAANLYRVPFHPTRDGNTVELGVEQAAFSQNAADFQTSLTFVNMKLRGLAKAIAGQ